MYVCPHKTTRHLWPVEKMVTAPAFTGQETSLNSHMPEVIHSNIYYMETLNWFQFLLVYPIRKFQNVLEAIESMTSTKFCNRKNVWIFQTHIMAKHLSSYPNILSLFPMTEFCLLCIGPRGIKKCTCHYDYWIQTIRQNIDRCKSFMTHMLVEITTFESCCLVEKLSYHPDDLSRFRCQLPYSSVLQ